MPSTLILNNNTVINANLDHFGRIGTFTGSVSVGNTTITPSTITVQSLVVGSISTSGAGGASTGFAITGNGSFTGALQAGSFSTLGTFSAGNTVFNGTVTLGNIGLQNGSITVGGTTINSNGMMANGIGYGGLVSVGFYADSTNLALRPPVASGTVYFQTPGGAASFATFSPTYANINTGLGLAGHLTMAGNQNIYTNGGFIQTDYSGNGGLRIINGGANQTGYIEFRTANTAANRLGYIGFGPTAGGAINIVAESGSYFNFTGAGGAPQINGSPIISNATLTSQLSNYATTSQLSSYATTAALGGYAPLSGATFSGTVTINNNPLIISRSTPYIDLLYPNVQRIRQVVDGNANFIIQNGDNGDNYFYINTGGAIWTKQFGDLNNRIESRGQAWGAWGRDQAVTSFRMTYITDLDITVNFNGGMAEYYGGSCVTGRASITSGDGNDIILRNMRFRQNQIYIAAQGWVAAYYA